MSSRPRFQLQAFAPGWGATVMGTGVTSVILSAWATIGFAPGLTQTASRIMLIVTLALAIPVVSLMITRLITHRDTARTELAHPVMGAMHVTLGGALLVPAVALGRAGAGDRKSTRLNSSHVAISYAVFCLKKKKEKMSCRL